MDATNKPAAPADAQRSTSANGSLANRTTASHTVAGSDAGKAPSPASRFMMRRSGGGRMTPINKQAPGNGNSSLKHEAKPSWATGAQAPSRSSVGVPRVESDIDRSELSPSLDFLASSQNRTGEKRRKSAEDDGYVNAKRTKDAITVATSSSNGYIPQNRASLDGRKYSQLKASNGSLDDAHGAITPSGHMKTSRSENSTPFASAVATALNNAYPKSRSAAPSAGRPDDNARGADNGLGGSSHSNPQRSEGMHASPAQALHGGSESSDGHSGSSKERDTGFSDLPDMSSVESPPDQAASRPSQQTATEADASVDSGPTAAPAAGSADFSAPMPANPDLMWKYIQQFTVVHRGEIPQRMYVPDFLNLRRLRELEWNDGWISAHQFKDSVPRDVSSMIMQVTGPYAPNPCTRCKGGHGPYKGCVLMPPDAPPKPQFMIYGCANCVYHGGQTNCSLQTKNKQEAIGRFPHLDVNEVRREVYSEANAAAGRLSAQSKHKARAARDARDFQKSPKAADKAKTLELRKLLADSVAARAGTESSTRNRAASTPNYNLKDLSRPSWFRGADRTSTGSAPPSNGDSAIRGAAEEPAKGPDEADGDAAMDFVEVQAAAPQAEPQVPDESVVENQNHSSDPIRQDHASAGRLDVGRAMTPMVSGLAGLLEMAQWEIGPGVIPRAKDDSDNIMFSSAYLTRQKMVPIADGMSCRVEFLKPGCTLSLGPEAHCVRTCSIIAGRVKVQYQGETYPFGPAGILKLLPGDSVVLQNPHYIDVQLQIMSVAWPT